METGIYKIINLLEKNKIYIGRCQSVFTKRWSEHIRDLNKGKHTNLKLQADWTKYGVSNFKFEVISRCDVITAKYRELDIIDSFRKQGFELYNVYSMRDDIILKINKYTHNLLDFESEIDLVDSRCRGKKLPLHWQLYLKSGNAEIYIHLYDRSKYVENDKLQSLDESLVKRDEFVNNNGYFSIARDVTEVYADGNWSTFTEILINEIMSLVFIFG